MLAEGVLDYAVVSGLVNLDPWSLRPPVFLFGIADWLLKKKELSAVNY